MSKQRSDVEAVVRMLEAENHHTAAHTLRSYLLKVDGVVSSVEHLNRSFKHEMTDYGASKVGALAREAEELKI